MEAEEPVGGVKARTVLWYLTFVGFAMNYMIRINVNIAIVDMIGSEFKARKIDMSECFSSSIVNVTNSTFYHVHQDDFAGEEKYKSLERRLLDFIGVRLCDSSAK